ncbi:MAG: hypothetical protein QCI38_01610, partial [Candidatus Thermoplasmatota archaeon]|nr:hypothetical protein [Candidatus Thermoplasmatota archaeon]
MHIITRWFGVFLVEAGEVKQKLLFPQNTDDVASRIIAIQDGQVLDEEREMARLVGEMDSGPVFVVEKRLAPLGIFEPAHHYIAPEEHGFSPGMLHDAMLKVAKSGLAAPKRDRMLIQAVGAMDELNKTCNLISERLAEWYGHHSHDLAKNLSPKTLAEVVASFGTVEEIVQNTELEGHRSGDLEQQDMGPIRSLAHLQLEVFKER